MPNAAQRGKGGGGNTVRFGKGAGGPSTGGGQLDPASKGTAWDCISCGLGTNFNWRGTCRGCGAPRKRDGAAGGQGSGASTSSSGSSRPQALAERQLADIKNAQKQQRRASEAENKRLRDELARAQAEQASRTATKPAKPTGGAAADAGDEDDELDDMDVTVNEYTAWTEDERQRQIEKARNSLAYMAGKFGEESTEVQNIKDEISSLQRASRDAKPFKAHRGMLERRRERLRAKLERDEAEIDKIKAEQKELQERLESLSTANDEKRSQLAQVEEELAELVRKALAEGDAAGAAGKQAEEPAQQWSALSASSAMYALASRPGIPPELAALLGHVYQAAQMLAGAESAAAAQAGAAAPTTTTTTNDCQRPHDQPPPTPHPTPPSVPSANNGQDAGGATGGATAAGSAASSSGSNAAADAPVSLAPQARWARNAAAAGGGAGKGAQGPPSYAAAVCGGAANGEATHGDTSEAAGGGTTGSTG